MQERHPKRAKDKRPSASSLRLTEADRRAIDAIISSGYARNKAGAISYALQRVIEKSAA